MELLKTLFFFFFWIRIYGVWKPQPFIMAVLYLFKVVSSLDPSYQVRNLGTEEREKASNVKSERSC